MITSSNTTAGGYLSRKSIQAQIDVLNQAYTNSGTGLYFNLTDIDCEYTDILLALQVSELQ